MTDNVIKAFKELVLEKNGMDSLRVGQWKVLEHLRDHLRRSLPFQVEKCIKPYHNVLPSAVDAYISEQCIVGDEVVAFWVEKAKLSEFAIDLLHVPATSALVERLTAILKGSTPCYTQYYMY